MANFTFDWADGSVTSLPLPSDDIWTCDNTSPSSEYLDIGGDIVMYATQTGNWNDTESYCIMGIATLQGLYDKAQLIRDQWLDLRNTCGEWDNWFRSCSCCGIWCYMNETSLNSAYTNWKNLPQSILNNINGLLALQTIATEAVYTDMDQAGIMAVLQQQIAETNNLISLTAYQNEIRELEVVTQKTKDIFVPIIIVLLLAGLGIYLIKD